MTDVLDLLGIGFGPAGISVAAAIGDAEESLAAQDSRLQTLFLERAPSAAWQPHMLLPGTDIQHHYLRDFASPRNPRSRYSFTNFLVETDRFFPFTLMGGYVSRTEWSQYVEWTAAHFRDAVRYNTDVLRVTPVVDGDRVTAARVRSVDTVTGREQEHLARGLAVSIGHQPYVPPLFEPHLGRRMFHSSQYQPGLVALPIGHRPRFAVVGAGQTAGEVFLHLAGAYPEAEIFSLARNSGFRMYNLGHFSNEAYFPAETDYFYALDHDQRAAAFSEVYSTNYAAVDPDVSTGMYRLVYEDRITGRNRLHMRKRTAVTGCDVSGGRVRLGLREVNTGAAEHLDVDAVILCTGYTEPRFPEMLEQFRPYIGFDRHGDPEVSRSYRLAAVPGNEVAVYLNGITEWRHGINSATSFSTMACKAGLIVGDLTATRGDGLVAVNASPRPARRDPS